MAKTSRLWPYIRAIAKALTIPGTQVTDVSPLAHLKGLGIIR